MSLMLSLIYEMEKVEPHNLSPDIFISPLARGQSWPGVSIVTQIPVAMVRVLAWPMFARHQFGISLAHTSPAIFINT